MTTKQFNSKGQLIEELDLYIIEVRVSFQSPKPVSPKQQEKHSEQEILAWCDYYLNYKKKNKPVRHIKF
jgi:hypothetical protein